MFHPKTGFESQFETGEAKASRASQSKQAFGTTKPKGNIVVAWVEKGTKRLKTYEGMVMLSIKGNKN